MHDVMIRFPQIGLRISAFIIWGFILGCAKVNGGPDMDSKVIEGQILYESTKEPLKHIEIILYREINPFFSMRGWERIAETKTDNYGRFMFEVSVPGPFEIRWNPESLVVANEFPVEDFEGSKNVLIFHVEREVQVYPWDEGSGQPQN